MKKQNLKKIEFLSEKIQVLNVSEQKNIKGGIIVIDSDCV